MSIYLKKTAKFFSTTVDFFSVLYYNDIYKNIHNIYKEFVMLEKIVEYCKDNLILVAVAAACVLLVLLAIVALCVKKSKAKKTAEKEVQTPVSAPVVPPAATPAVEEKPTVTTEKAEEKTATPAPVQKTKSVENKKPVEKKATAVKADPAFVPTATSATVKKTVKKPTRYSGKWVICRVVTAAHAEGNIHDEAADETFFFELHASNGEKLLTSEEYTTHNGALMGINTHKANIEKGNFRLTLSKKGDYLFKLLNGKNMLLCLGEHYATKASCESAIESTKRFAATAVIDENVQDLVIPNPTEEDETPALDFDENILGKWIVHASESADGDKVYYFELFASNGEKLLSSEEYTTYAGAVNGIETHKTNIEKGNFRVSFTKRGDYIYKLLNGNNQLLCLGEHYKTRRRCENAIESVKRFAKVSPVLADPKTIK